MSGTAYLLTLTEQDVETIARVGSKQFWSGSLCFLIAGDNILTWVEARRIREAIEADMVTGHNAYPGILTTSTLCTKLHNLYQSIV